VDTVDAESPFGSTRGRDVPVSPPGEARRRIFDDSLELRPSVRSALDESESSARLLWLEEQLALRQDTIGRLVSRWSPDGSTMPPEEALLYAFDELASENTRAQIAADLAHKQVKEAHSGGVEAGAVGAVLALGLIASAVAIIYALWQHFA
jgi:hypothetical protein